MDLKEEADPPAFKRARLLEEREREKAELEPNLPDEDIANSQKTMGEALSREIQEYLSTCKDQGDEGTGLVALV